MVSNLTCLISCVLYTAGKMLFLKNHFAYVSVLAQIYIAAHAIDFPQQVILSPHSHVCVLSPSEPSSLSAGFLFLFIAT